MELLLDASYDIVTFFRFILRLQPLNPRIQRFLGARDTIGASQFLPPSTCAAIVSMGKKLGFFYWFPGRRFFVINSSVLAAKSVGQGVLFLKHEVLLLFPAQASSL